MTKKQYRDKQYQRNIRFNFDNRMCQYPHCFKNGIQLAHRVARTKVNIKKYGLDFINHNINLVTACCLEHNSYFNIGNNPAKSKKLYEFYLKHKEEYSTTDYINLILEG